MRLSYAQDRVAVLTSLVRRHSAQDVDGVLAWAAAATERLLELDGADDRIAALQAQDTALEGTLGLLAAELSAARTAAALRFGAAVTQELGALAMPHAEVTAVVTQRQVEDGLIVDGRVLGATVDGVDEVEVLLVPHPGAPARALQKGASGGELSRVMLALASTQAAQESVPTLVFDEIDAGIGGRVGQQVGDALRSLAARHQVFAITHLPQLASRAHHHIVVEKGTEDGVTSTDVRVVTGDERALEVARMLGGDPFSSVSIAHAEELLHGTPGTVARTATPRTARKR